MRGAEAKLEELRRSCMAILEGAQDPFSLDVGEALEALSRLFELWSRPEQRQADAEVFSLVAQVLYLQSRRAVEQALLLAADPAIISQKVASSSAAQLAGCLLLSWRRLAAIEQLGPERLREAVEYYLSLPPLSARRLRLGRPRPAAPALLSRQELLGFRQLQEREIEQELGELEEELRREGEGEYYGFVFRKGEQEAAMRALLVAHLVSRGRAVLDLNPLEGKLTLRPAEGLAPGPPRSIAVPLRR